MLDNIIRGVTYNLILLTQTSDWVLQMSQLDQTSRRGFLTTTVAIGSLTGCLGNRENPPGTIDSSDLSVLSSGSAEFTVTNVRNNNDNGIKISTEDSITDGNVVSEIPISVQNAPMSTVYIKADVNELDDDAEIEIRFQSSSSSYRSIYIGNEYKTRENGVLATEKGSGYELRKKLGKLPSSEEPIQIKEVESIKLIIREGDFIGIIWALWFIFEDKTIVFL